MRFRRVVRAGQEFLATSFTAEVVGLAVAFRGAGGVCVYGHAAYGVDGGGCCRRVLMVHGSFLLRSSSVRLNTMPALAESSNDGAISRRTGAVAGLDERLQSRLDALEVLNLGLHLLDLGGGSLTHVFTIRSWVIAEVE